MICEATSANPNNNLEFTWSFNGTELNETLSREISQQEGTKSRIVISTVDDSLYGVWSCSVRNTVGQSNPNCTMLVDAPLGMCVPFVIAQLAMLTSNLQISVEPFAWLSVCLSVCSFLVRAAPR